MKKSDDPELARLRDRIETLEGRLDALSVVLHSSIIMADDALNRHREGIIDLLERVAEGRDVQASTVREWIGVLTRGQ